MKKTSLLQTLLQGITTATIARLIFIISQVGFLKKTLLLGVSRNFEDKPNNTNSNSVVELNSFYGTSTVTVGLGHNPNCSKIQQDMIPENAPDYRNSDNLSVDDEFSLRKSLENLKGFRIVHLNITSIPKHIDKLRIYLIKKPVDILSINETRLDESISNDEVGIPGYNLFRKDRNRLGGVAIYTSGVTEIDRGGVAIYTRNILNVVERYQFVPNGQHYRGDLY